MKKALIISIAIALLGCNNQKINEEITEVSYHNHPPNSSNIEKVLIITPDSIRFAVLDFSNGAEDYTTEEIAEKTPAYLWDNLMKMCDINTFRKIRTGKSRQDIDGADEEFILTTQERVMFFTNGNDSKYYKRMNRYFETLQTIATQMENNLIGSRDE